MLKKLLLHMTRKIMILSMLKNLVPKKMSYKIVFLEELNYYKEKIIGRENTSEENIMIEIILSIFYSFFAGTPIADSFYQYNTWK